MSFAYQMVGPGVDQVKKVEVPEIGAHALNGEDVKIRLRASSLNFHDFLVLSGLMPGLSYPRVPMSDGVGEVVAVGERVTEFKVGEKVVPCFYPFWQDGKPTDKNRQFILGESMDGCLQEYLVLEESSLVKAPKHMSDLEAGTLACAGHTAWYAMVEAFHLTKGDTVLLQGTGGVSLAALQIAKAIGAKVAITSSQDEKLAKAKQLGADYLVNYRTHEDWEKEVLTLTGGVDIALDTGGQQTLGRTVKCMNTAGRIGVIGVLSGFEKVPVSILDIMGKNLIIQGITVGCRASLDRYCRFTEHHNIQPVISHTVKASELAKGVDILSSGSHFGKVAIDIADHATS